MFYFLITLIPYIMYLILKYRRSFYMLQQNSYNVSNRYGKWIFRNIKKVFLNYDLFFIILIILYPYINHNFYMFFMAIFYFGLFYLELKNIKKDQNKKPFAITKRIKRLTITTLLLFGIVLLLIFINFNLDKNLLRYYIYLFVYCYLGYFITYLANIINYPVERMVYYYYYYKAVNKLNSMPNLVKIGITGSYGKTTSKNILNTILNIKFNSFATKKSLNTPYGLMTSINIDDLMSAIDRLNKVPDYNDLLKENQELKKQVEVSNELVAQGTLTEMKLRNEVNSWRKEYQDTYKDVRMEIKELKEKIEKIREIVENSDWRLDDVHDLIDGYDEIAKIII